MQKLLEMVLGKLGGLKGFMLDYVLKKIMDLLGDLWRRTQRAIEQKEAEKKMKEVTSDPKSTADQDGKAYEDFLNSGRH